MASKQQKVKQAQALAEQLRDVSPGELELLKRRIHEWADGDDCAKGYVFRFAYTERCHNARIIDQMIRLLDQ